MAKNIVDELAAKTEQQILKDIFVILDTETDGTKNGSSPLTFAMTRTDTGEVTHGIFDQGSFTKFKNRLQKAMNLRDEDGKLLDSAKQFRAQYSDYLDNIADDIEIKIKDLDKTKLKSLENYYETSKVNMESFKTQVLNMLKTNNGKMARLAAYNAAFDKKRILQLNNELKAGNLDSKELEELFDDNGYVDLFEIVAKQLPALYKAPKKRGVPKTAGSIGILKQEQIAAFLGIDTKGSHDASTDVKIAAAIKNRLEAGDKSLQNLNELIEKELKNRKIPLTKQGKWNEDAKAFAVAVADYIIENKVKLATEQQKDAARVQIGKIKIGEPTVGVPTASQAVKNSTSKTELGKKPFLWRNLSNEIYKQLGTKGNTVAANSYSGQQGVKEIFTKNGISKSSATTLSRYGAGAINTSAADDDNRFTQGTIGSQVYELQETVEKLGGKLEYEIIGNTVRFYVLPNGTNFSEDQKNNYINFDVVMADKNNMLQAGGLTVHNILRAHNDNGHIRFNTVQEEQLNNVLRILNADYISNISDLEANPKALRAASRRALQDISSSPNMNMQQELEGVLIGNKGPMQNSVAQGLMDFSSLIYELNKIYKFKEPRDSSKPWEIMNDSSFIRDFTLVISSALTGTLEELKATAGDNEVLQKMLASKAFIDELKELSELGIFTHIEGLKEQLFAKGMLALSGGAAVNPMTVFNNPANRSTTQVLNMLKRAIPEAVDKAHLDKFVREEGISQGINYKDARLEQIIGGKIIDEDLVTAFGDINKSGLDLEDAVILPKELAEKLTGYQTTTKTVYDKEVDKEGFLFNFKDMPEIHSELLKWVTGGEDGTLQFEKGIAVTEEWEKKFADKVELKEGDIITGFTKIGDKIQIIYESLTKVADGVKMLGQNGERLTARVIDTTGTGRSWEQRMKDIGLEGAQYLTAKKDLSAKTMSPYFGGRMRYIVDQGGIEAVKKVLDEDATIATQLNKIFRITGDTITDVVKYDPLKGGFVGTDDNLLFTGTKNEQIQSFKDLWNAIETLGQKVLGDKYNSRLYGGALGIADVASYEDATGGAGIDFLSREGRVKYDKKARAAEARKLNLYRNRILENENISEADYNRYQQEELDRINRSSQHRKKAQKEIDTINAAIDANMGGNISKINSSQQMEIYTTGKFIEENGKRYRETAAGTRLELEKNQVHVEEILKEWDHINSTEEDFNKTLQGRVKLLKDEMGWNDKIGIVVKDANISYAPDEKPYGYFRDGKWISATHHIGEVYLPDVTAARPNGEDYIPSGVGTALASFLRVMQNGSKTRTEAFESLIDTLEESANDKHSSLFKAANLTQVANSGFTNVVGGGKIVGGDDYANGEMAMSASYLKTFLQAEEGASVKDVKEATQQLIYAYQAQDIADYQKEVQEIQALIQESDIEPEKLLDANKELVNIIIKLVEAGKFDLIAKSRRYPLIRGTDLQHVKIKIDNQLSDGTIGVSKAAALSMHMDFDGDKQAIEFIQASRRAKSADEEKANIEMDRERAKVDKEVADLALKWKQQDKQDAKSEEEQLNDLAKEIIQGQHAQFAGLIAKYNFGYVGQFSNANTNVRNAMSVAGWEDEKADATSKGYAAIVRAFFQSLEQDAISAKKVFTRLEDEKGTQFAISELDTLFGMYRSGNLVGAANKAQEIGIFGAKGGMLDSEQFRNALAEIAVTNKEFWNQFTQNGLINAEEGKISLSLLSQALKKIQDMYGGVDVRTGEVKDIDSWKSLFYGNSSAGSAWHKAIEVGNPNYQPPHVVAQALIDLVENDNHDRKGKTLAGVEVLANHETSVSTLAHKLNPQKEEIFNRFSNNKSTGETTASTLGTYAHKILELMIKNEVADAEAIVGQLTALEGEKDKELEKAYLEAKEKGGSKSLNTAERGAELVYRYLTENGLLDKNKYINLQEEQIGYTLGKGKEITGRSDLLSFEMDDAGNIIGATVTDYKFSKDDSEETLRERIFQGSQYAALTYQQLFEEIKAYEENKTQIKGIIHKYFGYSEKGIEKAKQAKEALKSSRVRIARYMSGANALDIIENDALGIDAVKEWQYALLSGGTVSEKAQVGLTEGKNQSYFVGAQTDLKEAIKALENYNKSRVNVAKLEGTQSLLKEESEEYKALGLKIKTANEELERFRELSNKLIQEQSGSLSEKDKGILLGISQRGEEEVALINAKYSDKRQAKAEKEYNSAANAYLKSLRRTYQLEEALNRNKLMAEKAPGKQQGNYQAVGTSLERELEAEQQILAASKERLVAMGGLESIQSKINALDMQHMTNIQKQNAYYNKQRGILQMLFGTMRQSVVRFFDYSAAYMIINKFKQSIQQVVQYTAQLDAKLVDLQIATGYTREQIKGMLKEYNGLASQLGVTTTAVAEAANDWLRAGYEGKEATDLVNASIHLSKLGMIEASEATSDLISVLKGWKLESSEIMSVVDKLVLVDMNAAVSAGDIATAMQMVNYSAQQAGLSLDTLIGILTTNQEVTQRSAEVVGTSWKTVLARIQNVKAGKYAANSEDILSEDYQEEDWAALNDVETVLKSVGIELRSSINQWRSTEDILNEVARKWDSFDAVTQSAIANAFAGTRQRENFIATIANWTQVQKYAEMSANAYGTAVTKMESYTDSVEAAKNRVAAAVEEWALKLEGSEAMKKFYNMITDIMKNFPLVVGFGSLILIMSNFGQVSTDVVNGLINLNSKVIELGNVITNVATQANHYTREGKELFIRGGSVLANKQALNWISNFNAQTTAAGKQYKWNSDQLNSFGDAQYYAFSLNRTNQKGVLGDINKILGLDMNSPIGVQLHNIGTLSDSTMGVISQFSSLSDAGRELAKSMADGTYQGNRFVGQLRVLKELSQDELNQLQALEPQLQRTSTQLNATLKGITTMGGAMIGGYGLGGVGEQLGGSTGRMAGSMAGSMLGMYAFSSLGETGIMGAVSAAASATTIAATVAAAIPLVLAGGLIVAAGYTLWKKHKEQVIQDARDAFKEAQEDYTTKRNAGLQTERYDELVRGVDSLGRNLSLTSDEYAEFLKISNELASVFPELVVYVNDAGDKFVGLNNTISAVTSEVDNITQAAQNATNAALLNPTLVESEQKEVKKSTKQISESLDRYSNILNYQSGFAVSGIEAEQLESAFKKYGINYSTVEYSNEEGVGFVLAPEESEKLRSILRGEIQTLNNELASILGEYVDTYMAELQNSNADLYNGLTEEQKALVQTLYRSGLVDISKGTWKDDVKTIAQDVKDIANFVNVVGLSPENYGNIGSYNKAREENLATMQQAYDTIAQQFGETQARNTIQRLGYSVDEAGTVYNESTYKKLIEDAAGLWQGRSDYGQFLNMIYNLTYEQGEAALEVFSNSWISRLTPEQVLERINNESPVDTSIQGLSDFANRRAQQAIDIRSLKDAYSVAARQGFGLLSDETIEDYYGGEKGFSDAMIATLKDMRDQAKKILDETGEITEEKWDEIWNKAFNVADSGALSSYSQVVKAQMKDIFKDIEWPDDMKSAVKDITGIFGTLKEVLDSVTASYEKLTDAQKEQNSAGKLSIQTALDLISTDENYLGLLEVQDGNIRLVANAKEKMAEIQIKTAMAALEETKAALLAEAADIERALSGEQLATAEKGTVLVTDALTESLLAQADAALAASYGLQAAIATQNGESAAGFQSLAREYRGKSVNTHGINNSAIFDTLQEGTYTPDQIKAMQKRYNEIRNSDYVKGMNTGQDYLEGKITGGELAIVGQMLDAMDKALKSGNFGDFITKDYKTPSGDAYSKLDKLKDLLSSLNKEYEQWVSFTSGKRGDIDENYYDKKLGLLNEELEEIQKQEKIALANDDMKTYLSLLTEEQTTKLAILNLDDERVQDQIDILEAVGSTNEQLRSQYKALRDSSDTYIEYVQNIKKLGEASLKIFENQYKGIERKMKNLQNSKPHQWLTDWNKDYTKVTVSATDKINSYYSKLINYYQEEQKAAEAILNDSEIIATLTNDEIDGLVDKVNDAKKNILETQITLAEEIKSYQESVYNATTNTINRYIKDLERQKTAMEKYYDTEIEKLTDKNAAIERTNKLLELQKNLQKATEEKQRVYRAGVGWVYESNRESIRKAQSELDAFYRQDTIDDLTNAKEAEGKLLDERIQQWNEYLAMLEEQFKEYERIQEERLLMEYFHVSSAEEVQAILTNDMINFNQRLSAIQNDVNANITQFYRTYNSSFESFMNDYSANLIRLEELKKKELALMNSNYSGSLTTAVENGTLGYVNNSASNITISTNSNSSNSSSTKTPAKTTPTTTTTTTTTFDKLQNAISSSTPTLVGSNSVNNSLAKRDYTTDSNASKISTRASRANGILGGPITYTGLAMLHGSPSSPEYVLNNDQAYNLLKYLATKPPEFTSTMTTDNGTQYIVQGDIVLENCDDPAQFWNEVTQSMSNRFNVTKNRNMLKK